MNPIYKFQLSAGNDTRQAFPAYKDDLAIDYALEQNQEFYRGKLSGKLTFQKDDYLFIQSKAFDTQFDVVISISYDGGQTWTVYWSGQFWKTDCEFNEDDQTVIVTPNVNDRYNAILAGMEKEYNLIDLAPVIQPIKSDKRPMIQVYIPGQTVIGCFLSGMWWEQECESVLETDTVEIGGHAYPALTHKYFFSYNKGYRVITVEQQTGNPEIPKNFFGAIPADRNASVEYYSGEFSFAIERASGGLSYSFYIKQNGITLWQAWKGTTQEGTIIYPFELTMSPPPGSTATGQVKVYVQEFPVYARFVCDTESINGTTTQELPSDDLVANNRNYTRVTDYYFPETIWFSTEFTNVPNQWGIYQPGQYYKPPYLYWDPELFPVARNAWGRISIWFTFSAIDELVEKSGRQAFTIKHTYPIASVISVLLAKVAPGITHAGTTDYSQFLYGTNLIGITQTLLITPKSNLVTAGYDQPAQKAPITLKVVFDMLRDCFRCYWFIDDQNRLRIEHIEYFRNGGSYSELPVVGIDLTAERVSRNGKPWAFAANKFTFDKPEMAARYQFGWMDDVTQLFEGYPIDIISKFVNPDNIEQIDVSQFTSDIDYILLNPSEISKDGFVLLAATRENIIVPETSFNATPYTKEIAGLIPGETLKLKFEAASPLAGTHLAINFVDENQQVIRTFFNNVVPQGQNELEVSGIIPTGTAGLQFGASNSIGIKILFVSGYLSLPYVNFDFNGNDHILQNGLVSFTFLQQYYAYDMPAPNYVINGEEMEAIGTKRLKTQQIKFPALYDPDLVKQIRTGLGDGTIQKISINLSSRNATATLKYDTE